MSDQQEKVCRLKEEEGMGREEFAACPLHSSCPQKKGLL
jgi:hypothetical protein